MEIRDLIVSVDPSESGRERMRFAIRLAARFGAHLTGYYTGPTVGLLPAGPAFEVTDLGPEPDAALRELGARALRRHPALADVVARL